MADDATEDSNDILELAHSPNEAQDALRFDMVKSDGPINFEGQAATLAEYLSTDVPDVLAAIIEHLERRRQGRRIAAPKVLPDAETSNPTENDDPYDEISERDISETDVAVKLTQAGSVVAMTSFLRDLSGLVAEIGAAVNPTGDTQLYLQLRKRRKGRPTDEIAEFFRDSETSAMVRRYERKFGKKEAAVQAVMDGKGISRAEVFRAIERDEGRKRPR